MLLSLAKTGPVVDESRSCFLRKPVQPSTRDGPVSRENRFGRWRELFSSPAKAGPAVDARRSCLLRKPVRSLARAFLVSCESRSSRRREAFLSLVKAGPVVDESRSRLLRKSVRPYAPDVHFAWRRRARPGGISEFRHVIPGKMHFVKKNFCAMYVLDSLIKKQKNNNVRIL